VVAKVMIGVDPHKRLNAVCVICRLATHGARMTGGSTEGERRNGPGAARY
jgi:hypothetical protein